MIRIIVLGTCVRRHGTKISTCKVHRYRCMCKMVASLYAAVETQRRIVKYQYIVLEIQWTALSMENVSWKIFGDGCVGHKCMNMTVARPTT
jgi:hypothetical protein